MQTEKMDENYDCNKYWNVYTALFHTDYNLLSYRNRDVMDFPLWAAAAAVMAWDNMDSGTYRIFSELEYLELCRIIFISGDYRQLCYQTDYRGVCME